MSTSSLSIRSRLHWVGFKFLPFLYYDQKTGDSKRCPFCGSSQFLQHTTDLTANVICQYAVICQDCNQEVNYWAYGSYNPGYKNPPSGKRFLQGLLFKIP